MKHPSIPDSIVSCAVIVMVALTLLPALGRMTRPVADAKCQSNMHCWAEAVALYVGDNNGTYPTNRTKAGVLTIRVMLSAPALTDPPPIYFQNGFNWVEALYTYLWEAAARTDRDWKSFRRCPNASSVMYPSTSHFASMSYVFNYNLIEYSTAQVRTPEKVMMIREFDRLLNSELRPTVVSRNDSKVLPSAPFLTTSDPFVYTTNPNMHGSGSYIAFADGHVGYFTTDYFPVQSSIDKAHCWDSPTGRWWNWAPTSDRPPNLIKAIAITP